MQCGAVKTFEVTERTTESGSYLIEVRFRSLVFIAVLLLWLVGAALALCLRLFWRELGSGMPTRPPSKWS